MHAYFVTYLELVIQFCFHELTLMRTLQTRVKIFKMTDIQQQCSQRYTLTLLPGWTFFPHKKAGLQKIF